MDKEFTLKVTGHLDNLRQMLFCSANGWSGANMYAGRNSDGNMFIIVVSDTEDAMRRAVAEGIKQALAVGL